MEQTAEDIEVAREQPAPIGVIDSDTYRRLLEHFRKKHPEYLAAVVLAGFCGLRRAEIHTQSWDDILLDRKFVRVTSAKKRNSRPAHRAFV
jgi:integrase